MHANLEDIFAALFAVVQKATINGNPAFVTTSRKFQIWNNVPAGAQPALFQRQGNLRASQAQTYGLTKWGLRCTLWIYCKHSPDSGSIPSQVLNGLVNAVDDILSPRAQGFPPQTLGGLVTNCYIDGDAIYDEGEAPDDTQSICVLSIFIDTGV